MNFAVTGGAGFVGSHIVKRLVLDGHSVTVVDNLSRGSVPNLEGVHDKIDFIRMDIREYDRLNEVLCDADGIFHQAALAYIPGSYENEDEYRQVNVAGTANVFRIGLEHGIRIVYASSSTVYGNGQGIPIQEDVPRKPLNPYGMTKFEAELAAERYTKRGARIVSLRYFNVVGLGRKQAYSGVIPRFLDRIKEEKPPIIYGDGSQIKDFVFVHDVVRANLAAMTSKVKEGFFNIGSGRSISITDLARLMIKISGKSLEPEYQEPRPGDVKMSVADISKAGRMLGWKPNIVMEEGLQNLLAC